MVTVDRDVAVNAATNHTRNRCAQLNPKVMRNILTLLMLLIVTNLSAQIDSEKEIITTFLTPLSDLKPVPIYNKRGKVVKMAEPSIDNLVVNRYTNSISDSAESYDNLLKNGLSDLDSSTYSNFIELNKSSYELDSIIVPNRIIFFIDTSEAQNIIKNGQWTYFFNKYPNSKLIMSLSRIGFNNYKNQALIYTTNNNYLSGNYGFYMLYSFVDNKWKVIQSIMVFLKE
jgi:hypothetical protein